MFLDDDVVKELFDVDEHVKKVVHDAFEQCDTSQVFYISTKSSFIYDTRIKVLLCDTHIKTSQCSQLIYIFRYFIYRLKVLLYDTHIKVLLYDTHIKTSQCSRLIYIFLKTGKLSPEEFRSWADRHSYILDIIFGHKSFSDKQKV
jgi:hypothetical protein